MSISRRRRPRRALGWQVALVGHDPVSSGRDLFGAIARVPADQVAVYRGWMVSSHAYHGLAAALAARGVRLWTGPEQYRRGHELPGWYAALSAFTPESVWTAGTGRDDFDQARAALGAGPGRGARLQQVDDALLARGGLYPRSRRRGHRVGGRPADDRAARRRI